MIRTLVDELAFNPPKEIGALTTLLETVTDDQRYEELVERVLSDKPNFQQRKALLNIGMFGPQDFLHLIHASGQGGVSLQAATVFLQRLNEWALVSDHRLVGENALVQYRWDKERIKAFLRLSVLDNALFGASYIAQKYRASVPAVFVTKNGDAFTGTGFLALSRLGGKPVIVTAKHNVDPKDGIAFASFNRPEGVEYMPESSEWVLHPTLDLALMPVRHSGAPVPIYPVGLPAVLSGTITLGYPRIATTDAPYLLAHGGELNAIVKTYFGEEHLIISNVVAPGNSGGPVLDKAGICLGMVIRSLESEHEGGVNKMNAAVPASEIIEFIHPYCI